MDYVIPKDRVIKLIKSFIQNYYPNFTKDKAETAKYSFYDDNDDDSNIEYYDPIIKGYKGTFATYYFWTNELKINRELYDALLGFFGGELMEYVIDWFNEEFNQDAKYVTF
jgi:hypothetical protein